MVILSAAAAVHGRAPFAGAAIAAGESYLAHPYSAETPRHRRLWFGAAQTLFDIGCRRDAPQARCGGGGVEN